MVTTMQDRLQERSLDKRTTTSSDCIMRLTDRLLRLGSKISDCFSHGSRAGTTTRRDMATTRVAAAACNGTDYNNCDVSTTATSTTGSDTEFITSADTDLQSTPTFTAVDNSVDLINPLLDNCTHYILMMGATTTTTTCSWSCSSSSSSSRSTCSWTTTSHATSSSITTTYCVRWYYTTLSGVDTGDSQLPEHQQLRVCTTNGLLPTI